jgi:hypothetical protein
VSDDEHVRPATTPRGRLRNVGFAALADPAESFRLAVLLDAWVGRWPDLPPEVVNDLSETIATMATPLPTTVRSTT